MKWNALPTTAMSLNELASNDPHPPPRDRRVPLRDSLAIRARARARGIGPHPATLARGRERRAGCRARGASRAGAGAPQGAGSGDRTAAVIVTFRDLLIRTIGPIVLWSIGQWCPPAHGDDR